MRGMIKSAIWAFFFGWVSLPLLAQDRLEDYVREALESNLVLQQKKGALDKSMVALKEAHALFLPTTWFETQYTLTSGGRAIEIPVGDLLNPVYATLNQLTSSNSFPKINNVSEQLAPNNFYDARIKTTLPLINPDLRINREIREQQTELKKIDIDTYKRELVKEVKTAYYNYLLAGKAIRIYENALDVVKQNLRANQSLVANGKGLPAYVSRAESEQSQVEAQLVTARNEQLKAKAYFNFLLNKPLGETILEQEYQLPDDISAITHTPDSLPVAAREELKSLDMARQISGNVLKMARSFRTPRLNTFLDLGSQGFDFRVNNQSFFYLAGLQLQIPIFNGKRNLYKIESAQIELEQLVLEQENTQKQLQLSVFVSRANAVNAYRNYLSSQKQEEAARQYFKLIDRGNKEGVNSFIEWIDARNQLTNSQLQSNINTYKFLSSLADFERQTASYSINQ